MAGRTFQRDGPPHQGRELGRDCQPQTRAAIAPGGQGILLFKGFKNARLGFRLDATPGVSDAKGVKTGGRLRHTKADRALFCELDRVGQKVEQDLPQLGHIPQKSRRKSASL